MARKKQSQPLRGEGFAGQGQKGVREGAQGEAILPEDEEDAPPPPQQFLAPVPDAGGSDIAELALVSPRSCQATSPPPSPLPEFFTSCPRGDKGTVPGAEAPLRVRVRYTLTCGQDLGRRGASQGLMELEDVEFDVVVEDGSDPDAPCVLPGAQGLALGDAPADVLAALVALLRQGLLTASALRSPGAPLPKKDFQRPDAPGIPGGEVPGATAWRLRIGVPEGVLADSPLDPAEDGRKPRGTHAWMAVVMPWLRPEVLTGHNTWLPAPFAGACTGPRSSAAGGGSGPERPEDGRPESEEEEDEEEGFAGGAADAFHALDFYAAIRPTGLERGVEGPIPHLRTQLRPYQRRAVHWMLGREGAVDRERASGDGQSAAMGVSGGDHPLWQPLRALPDGEGRLEEGEGRLEEGEGRLEEGEGRLEEGEGRLEEGEGRRFFYNRYTGRFSTRAYPWQGLDVRGGVLAEEMGLGKTVELLACVVHNPWPGPQPEAAPPPCPGLAQTTGNATEGASGEGASAGGEPTQAGGEGAAASREECGATLIVCPTSILSQWKEEIVRHVEEERLRVLVYQGVQASGSWGAMGVEVLCTGKQGQRGGRRGPAGRGGAAGAEDLASALGSADIVLTTYDVLLSDIWHDFGAEGPRRLRYKKRYEVLPTPLTQLLWWRVCLDEAQLVEGSTSKASEMASRLECRNRWCITGTPIQRGLHDLYGLLRFLRVAPFDERAWWVRALEEPCLQGEPRALEAVQGLFRALLWRHSKADVADELGLPAQTQWASRLHFSAVESYFYERQHSTCGARALAALREWERAASPQHAYASDSAGRGTRRRQGGAGGGRGAGATLGGTQVVDRVMGPLLRLRQACCHPQIGASGLRTLQPGKPMSMADVLQVLKDKARLEAEEAQRLVVSALNGLAAVAAIHVDCPSRLGAPQGRLASGARGAGAEGACGPCAEGRARAVELYREALLCVEENAAEFRADPLQKLHTLHNLAVHLGLVPSTQGPTPAPRSADEGTPAVTPEVPPPVTSEGSSVAPQAKAAAACEVRPPKRRRTGRLSHQGRRSDEAGAPAEREGEAKGGVGISKDSDVGGEGDIAGGPTLQGRGDKRPQGQGQPGEPEVSREEAPVKEEAREGAAGPDSDTLAQAMGQGTGRGGAHAPPRTLRDDLLLKQCAEIRETYMVPFQARLEAARREFEACHAQVLAAWEASQASFGDTPWWVQLLTAVARSKGDPGVAEGVVERVRRALLDDQQATGGVPQRLGAGSLARRFSDARGLALVLQQRMDQVLATRDKVMGTVKSLGAEAVAPSAAAVQRLASCTRCIAGNVQLGGGGGAGVHCDYCAAQDLFSGYEASLFTLKSGTGGRILSLEEAADMQQKTQERNRLNRLQFLQTTVGARPRKGGGVPEAAQRAQEQEMDLLGRGVRQAEAGQGAAGSAMVTWSPCETERCLSLLYSSLGAIPVAVLGSKGIKDALLASAKHSLEALEGMRKEFQVARAWSEAQRGALLARDELEMAVTRITLLGPGERPGSGAEAVYRVFPDEVPGLSVRLTSDRLAAQAELARSKGQLRYLKGLAVAQRRAAVGSSQVGQIMGAGAVQGDHGSSEGGSGAEAPGAGNGAEPCPICTDSLQRDLAMLPCGHVLCCKCALALIDRAKVSGPGPRLEGSPSSPLQGSGLRRIGCPTCRQRAFAGDVAFVQQSGAETQVPGAPLAGLAEAGQKGQAAGSGASGGSQGAEETEDEGAPGQEARHALQALEAAERELELKGSFGTKMDAVTRRVRQLLSQDDGARVLVFSSWKDVLVLVEHCLRANQVQCRRVLGPRDLPKALSAFKASEAATGPRVLLLTTQAGSNGLNIVEAQHVVLVEPLLNPAVEAQAVNRVHRIGQTRPTFVHRFIVLATVEEGILALNQKRAQARGGMTGVGKREKETLSLADICALFPEETAGFRPRAPSGRLGPSSPTASASALAGGSPDAHLDGREGLRRLSPGAAAAAAAEARLRGKTELSS